MNADPFSLRYDAATFDEAATGKVAETVGGADLDVLTVSFQVVRLSTRLVQRLEAEVHHPAGWSMAGFRVMFCVWVADELVSSEIARLSGLSRAAVSSALNTLERDGLIARYRESEDRRVVTVRLTPEGESRLVTAYEQQNQVEQEFFGALSRADLRRFGDYLRTLVVQPRSRH